jgi:hypothetical protein
MPGAAFVIDAEGGEMTRWLALVFGSIATSATPAL